MIALTKADFIVTLKISEVLVIKAMDWSAIKLMEIIVTIRQLHHA